MKCIKVQFKDIEKTRVHLLNNNLLNKNYKILKDNNSAFIPVKSEIKGFEIYNKKLVKIDSKKSLKELLKKELNKKE